MRAHNSGEPGAHGLKGPAAWASPAGMAHTAAASTNVIAARRLITR
jgi:hypothetical protein